MLKPFCRTSHALTNKCFLCRTARQGTTCRTPARSAAPSCKRHTLPPSIGRAHLTLDIRFRFPQFVETCRDHIRDQPELNEPDFEIFEEMCLEQDGLALVEYALDLQNSGCHVELGNFRRQMQADLRDRYFLGQWIGPSAPLCSWDEIDDWARDTDTICCGNQMHHCHADSYGVSPPEECTPACAVALHTFTTACAEVLTQIIGDRAASINDFHMQVRPSLPPLRHPGRP